jgi:hypothetical protein
MAVRVNFPLTAYTKPALNAVNFVLGVYSPTLDGDNFAMSLYIPPASTAVDFILTGMNIIETINCQEFPRMYYQGTTPKELRSRVVGATIVFIANTFPHVLTKTNRTNTLLSRWS